MGKKQDISSLAISIGNTSAHKIILAKTNKPESKKHLTDEIRDYSFDAFSKSQLHNWAKEDVAQLIKKSSSVAEKFLNRYPDIIYKEKEIKEAVIDTMQELLII